MAGKITDLTALTGANLATGDLFEVIDISDTTLAATGTNKKITASELAIGLAPKFTTQIVTTAGFRGGSGAGGGANGSASDPVYGFPNGSNGQGWYSRGVYTVGLAVDGVNMWDFDASDGSNRRLLQTANGVLAWISGSSIPGSIDTGLARNAAGVLEANNGTRGTLRDIKLRSLIMTQGSGSVIILPTSDPSVSGALWNNGGTIAISA